MLLCNGTMKQKPKDVRVAAFDPIISMQAIENTDLRIAEQVRAKLKAAIETL